MTTRFLRMPVEPIAVTVLTLTFAAVVLTGSMAMDEPPLSPSFSSTLIVMASTCMCICFSHFATGRVEDFSILTWWTYLVLDTFVLAAFTLLLPRDESRKLIDHLLTATPVPVFPELSLSPLQMGGPIISILIGLMAAAIIDRAADGVRERMFFAFHMCAGATVLPSAVYSAHGYETAAAFLYQVVLYVVLWRALAFASTSLVLAELRRRRRDGAASEKPGQELGGGGAGPSSGPDSCTPPHPLLPVLQALPVRIAFPLVPMDAHVSQAEPQAEPQADPAILREAILHSIARLGGRRRSSSDTRDECSVEAEWVSASPSHSSVGDSSFLAEHEASVFGEELEVRSISSEGSSASISRSSAGDDAFLAATENTEARWDI